MVTRHCYIKDTEIIQIKPDIDYRNLLLFESHEDRYRMNISGMDEGRRLQHEESVDSSWSVTGIIQRYQRERNMPPRDICSGE